MTEKEEAVMKRNDLIKGYSFAILSAVIFGCMPLMASYIYADGASPMTLVFLRNFLALPPLAVLALLEKKTLAVPVKALPTIALIAGMGCCFAPALLFSSYRYIPSGTATTFHFIYPAVVVLAGLLFFRRRAQIGNILGVVMCILGVFLFYAPGEALDWNGSALALLSGVVFAVYVLLIPGFAYRKTVSGFLFSFYIAACSSVIMFLVCVLTGNLALPRSLFGWLLCAGFALVVNAGAVVLLQQAIFTIGGERASILSTLEPITSILLGVAVFHETLTVRTVIGSVLVIGAGVLIAALDLRKKK